ncbi:MAG: MBL fold metallo-hydrolase [Deltaproteobacteria bacterium]|nr:MBL fold metallo-hydrolase [Deltaproteobacteria bacterium]
MEVRLTTLCENTASKPGFMAEWGISVLIQVDNVNVLFDTGAYLAAVRNADKLGVDLSTIDKIVLSHGHADHTGGLRQVLRRTGETEVIAHPDIWDAKFTKRPYETKEAYIGIPFVRDELELLGASFNLAKDPVHISDHIMTTGEVEMITDYEIIEPNLLVKKGDTLGHDPLADDLSMIVKTEKGLAIILGCAHRGTINTIRHAQRLTGEERIYAVIGGTHLGPATEERVDKTIDDLKKIGVQKIGVSHCTGFKASMHVAQAFGDRFFVNNAGTQVVLP